MKLKGNENIKLIIGNMLRSGRFPHALILEGEAGLGKHTFALEISSTLLCENGATEPCGFCRGCELIRAHTHPDFKIISPNDKNIIPVDAIRALRKDAFIRPDRNGKKVYIIEAEFGLKIDSQNALLKILEEPPEYIVFIILTRSSEQFLDTIISRCVTLSLKAPNEALALEILREKLPLVSEEELINALSFNDYNIGRALSQLDGASNEVSSDAREILRLVGEKKAYETLRVLSKYERDIKGFSMLLSLMESAIEITLRNSSVLALPLSKEELIFLKEHIRKYRDLSTKYVSQNLLVTSFSAGLFR